MAWTIQTLSACETFTPEFAPRDQLNVRAAEWVDAAYAEMERSRRSALMTKSS